jgi:hypothetical protein
MDDGKSPRVETWGEESSPDSRPKGLSSPLGRPASAVVFLQTIIYFTLFISFVQQGKSISLLVSLFEGIAEDEQTLGSAIWIGLSPSPRGTLLYRYQVCFSALRDETI